jgi:hypothetical protein
VEQNCMRPKIRIHVFLSFECCLRLIDLPPVSRRYVWKVWIMLSKSISLTYLLEFAVYVPFLLGNEGNAHSVDLGQERDGMKVLINASQKNK